MPRIDLFYYGDTSPGQSPAQLYREIEEQIVLGDQLGYHGAWVTEHHFQARGEVPDPLTLFARLSGTTERIRLGTSIACAPYYHPIRLAEQAALVDALSGGRLDLGVGTGMTTPELAAVWGFQPDDAARRAKEVHEILTQAFDDGVVNYAGEFYNYSDVRISPPAGRPASDLIWTAAGRNAIPLATAHGFRLMIPRPLPLAQRLQINAEYRAAVPGGEVIHLRSGLVGPTRELARERAVEFLREYAAVYLRTDWRGGPDSEAFDDIAEKLSFAVGTAEEVADKIWEWTEQFGGTEETAIQFHGPHAAHAHALESIELFATQLDALQADAPRTSVAWEDRGIPDRPVPAGLTPYTDSVGDPDVRRLVGAQATAPAAAS
ncbi:LLM class flavin-dependent oxidoreductase [Leucobacter aridicollis]|uniref:Alkanesulfonate monooxygenase SsuD/methylene tetrahydromethanopterin reductase-like flavin-dependent oxidoreductase (Luciferase family) n=1 Tax=Leucobacter aridicollis TaxID=283878 RepID=A0A852QZX1_9MICO|nr:LLM class flavin-dependent oxidoreductase [Leucobacter aridicollis]MBL3682391.1 LLM class flavin-dependent oxidoreductase [Leucobacter aridicollis]NYD25807.1 alkanesulfonate monooxygenase SsuD/methylene tetrahydromethanopterin reductase-like flavin-dependent oxidoreductase (luciferase family) [Leucobacter aridicollis]